MVSYHLQSDFRFRLVRLRDSINKQLELDENGFSSPYFYGSFLPFLFQVYSFIWMKDERKLFARFFKK